MVRISNRSQVSLPVNHHLRQSHVKATKNSISREYTSVITDCDQKVNDHASIKDDETELMYKILLFMYQDMVKMIVFQLLLFL